MRANLFRTLWFNLRAFGLRKGLRMPVYVYGRVKVYNMGRILLTGPVERGMLKIGRNYDDTALPYTIWNNQGTIEVQGRTWIHHGCRLLNRGYILFRGGDIISHACVFDIRERLEFGRHVSVGYASEFVDTDVHYMVDVESRTVRPNTKPIRIGSYNWLGSHTFVKKGTVTPDCTIVASPNALLLKDYTQSLPPYAVLGGSPARVIAQGKRRILNFRHETQIAQALQGGADEYRVAPDVDLDEFCGLALTPPETSNKSSDR